ncbi:MAG: DUF3473 domain-containing protein [Rhodospirillales bacterium]|nr:MAG: DUF3473 domain-containing protein [Rhodospirillales bacterium]
MPRGDLVNLPAASEQRAGAASVPSAGRINAMSVDVEDYFHVSGFSAVIDRSDWERLPRRVDRCCHRVLDIFDQHNVRATFFVLAWVAARHPELVRRMVADGHEVASHGCDHVRVDHQTPEAFFRDAEGSRKALEDISGRPVKGFRAPSFSIGATNLWAFDVLAEAGYRYSSSVYPIRHDHYGLPDAPRFPYHPASDGGLIEIPISTTLAFGRRLPCGGGGFFRLLPYALCARALKRVNSTDGQPGVFYFHPWELDTGQPRITQAPWSKRARHYVNIAKMEAKLQRLLTDFHWGPIDVTFGIH